MVHINDLTPVWYFLCWISKLQEAKRFWHSLQWYGFMSFCSIECSVVQCCKMSLRSEKGLLQFWHWNFNNLAWLGCSVLLWDFSSVFEVKVALQFLHWNLLCDCSRWVSSWAFVPQTLSQWWQINVSESEFSLLTSPSSKSVLSKELQSMKGCKWLWLSKHSFLKLYAVCKLVRHWLHIKRGSDQSWKSICSLGALNV